MPIDNTNNCEHGCDHPAPTRKRFCSQECEDCEHAAFDDSKHSCANVCGQRVLEGATD